MFRTIRDIEVAGKTVLVRVDFNVPLNSNLEITDDTRISRAIPTLRRIIQEDGKLVIMSHLGRPKGQRVDKYSLRHIVKRVSELLNTEVKFAPDCVGDETSNIVKSLNNSQVALLENLRFHKGEEANDPEFTKALASMGDVFVSDAFGTAHRAHASTAGIADYLPSYAGLLMEKEIQYLGKVTDSPDRPLAAIMGGAKVSDKILVIENLLEKVDSLLIGGGMAFTFLKAKGYEIGKSLCEDDSLELANKLMEKARLSGKTLLLPIDVVVSSEIKQNAQSEVADVSKIPEDKLGLDIGPDTIEVFKAELKSARTILWNGPMGVFETSPFDQGTRKIAQILTETEATTVVGGGDSVAAIEQMGASEKISHVSTGGGACLEFLEGKVLPGIEIFSRDIKQISGGA